MEPAPNYSCVCGARMKVLDSRPAHFMGMSSVRRRRCCIACGLRITTFEVTTDAVIRTERRLQSAMRLAHQAFEALGTLIAAYDEIPDGTHAVIERSDPPLDTHPGWE
ncbi:MAG TPA: hypothetical protein VF748_07550 [Candidatus Acidoferrum sp.]